MSKWSEFHEGDDGKFRKFGIKGIIQPVCEKLVVIAKVITARINDIITQMYDEKILRIKEAVRKFKTLTEAEKRKKNKHL